MARVQRPTDAKEIETVEVPRRMVDLAERRTRAIVRASLHDANVLRTLALSCYLQGLEDGYAATIKEPSDV